MEPALLGLVLDSSVIIEAERRHETVEDLLTAIRERFGKVTVIISAELAGSISGNQATKGIKLPIDDLLIGASAIEQGYAVATLNRRHFEKIPDLSLLSF